MGTHGMSTATHRAILNEALTTLGNDHFLFPQCSSQHLGELSFSHLTKRITSSLC